METGIVTPFNELAAKKDPLLTLEQAVALFDLLADMEGIAFGFASDGCYARAHLMCRKLQEMGFTPQKAWALEKGSSKLTVSLDGQKLRWWFHVAPALAVKMPDGMLQQMVFDPGLFDGPVTLKEWGGIMKAGLDQLQIAEFDKPPAGYEGGYCPNEPVTEKTDQKAKDTMKCYMDLQRTLPRKVFSSQCRQQVSQVQSLQSQPQGKTWVSIPVPLVDDTPKMKPHDDGWGFDLN